MAHRFADVDEVTQRLAKASYLATPMIANVAFLADRLEKPVLAEGPAGVGKTELAKALAAATGARLLRLQCYEGIDVAGALYDWDYPRQLLHLRADGEFEAFLLEFLSDFQVTVPEVGVIRAETPPAVIITSNRTRELHEALKRRCLYHWIEHPDLAREVAIARARLPEAPESLVRQVCAFVQELRWLDLYRVPGVGETLDWAQSLDALDRDRVEPVVADRTLGALLKAREDLDRVREEGVERLMERGLERAGEDGHGEAA